MSLNANKETVDFSVKEILQKVETEYYKAREKHGPMRGPHEGYATILEELDELWEHVKNDTTDSKSASKEAIQVAAMAIAFYLEVCVLK